MFEENQNDYFNPIDHLMLNPETVNYQNQNFYALNTPIIDLGPVVENIKEKAKNWWEDFKENLQQQSLTYNQDYLSSTQPNLQQNYDIKYPLLEQPSLQPIFDQNSIIHEELAQKTKELTEQKEEIQCLQIEDEKNKKRISKLEKQIKELRKEQRLLGWVNRAINDSKKERII